MRCVEQAEKRNGGSLKWEPSKKVNAGADPLMVDGLVSIALGNPPSRRFAPATFFDGNGKASATLRKSTSVGGQAAKRNRAYTGVAIN